MRQWLNAGIAQIITKRVSLLSICHLVIVHELLQVHAKMTSVLTPQNTYLNEALKKMI